MLANFVIIKYNKAIRSLLLVKLTINGCDYIRYTIQTFGCKVNQYESATIAKAMYEHGYERTEDLFSADIIIINSCSVTENSDKKAKQLIERIKRRDPMKIIALTGCFPQAFPAVASSLSADIVTGTEHKEKLAEMIDAFTSNNAKQIAVPPRPVKKQYEKNNNAYMGKTRAFIKIEDGCDRFCSYCIIPTARGSVRSRPLDDIKEETEFQVSCGHKEMVLVGINLSCYGSDMGLRLADAIETVCSVDGVERVRLSSLEPELLTDSDIARMAAQKKLCPHFHLSLQSGSSATLSRMNRRYTPDEYLDIVNKLRAAFPDCAITTDVMVGFIGETDAEFRESCEFVKKAAFSGMHVFTYSVREGTAAAKMNGRIPSDVAAERYRIMSGIAKQLKERYFASCVGKTEKVLIQRRESEEYANGLTPQYVPVRIYGSNAQKQDIISVQITSASGSDFCVGEEIKSL